MHFLRKLLGLSSLLFISLSACSPQLDESVIMLATTTSTENSGLLEYLLPRFEASTGKEVRVIAVGTGKALKMGEQGDVDAVMVHAKPAEQAFVDAGYGLKRVEFMYNDFVLVGPPDDPAGLRKTVTIREAMRALQTKPTQFISRGDDSGTHIKELKLWEIAGVDLDSVYYRESGQGMGKTLQITNELGAYTLVDRGTWLSYRAKLDLDVLFEGRPPLYNQYSMILVNPARFPERNSAGAQTFIDWLISDRGQALIGAYKLQETTLFRPNA